MNIMGFDDVLLVCFLVKGKPLSESKTGNQANYKEIGWKIHFVSVTIGVKFPGKLRATYTHEKRYYII